MADEAGGLVIDPMHQFQIKAYSGDWGIFTVTNQTLSLGVAVLVIALFLIIGSSGRALVPGRLQSMAELLYSFIHDMVEDVTGHEGARFFPILMVIFTLIVTSNLLGLIPGVFAPTSHIAMTATLALIVFLMVTLVGFYKKGIGFLGMFWVSSAPLVLRPILALIEVISYFVRPLSHSIRLGGNIMAGHAVMKVFAGFAGVMGVASVVPIAAIAAIYGLELLVAVVQAYVFTILTCVYLRDAVGEAHH